MIRRAAAAVLVAAAVLAVLLALDVLSWRSGLASGDRHYARSPQDAAWTASPILPGDPAGSLLAVAGDLSARDALRLHAIAVNTPKGYDNGQAQARARARAEVALSDVSAEGSPEQASQAANLFAVLVVDSQDPRGPVGAGDAQAGAAFESAIRADPANEAAKFNLELLLRRQKVVGTRQGNATGSSAQGSSKAGAGAGLPGKGY